MSAFARAYHVAVCNPFRNKLIMLHVLILFIFYQKWLKPRGQLLVGDYCLGNSPLTDSVAKVLTAEGIQPLDSLALSQVSIG